MIELVLKCNKGNTLIRVLNVFIDDTAANTTAFPELDKDFITRRCFSEIIAEIRTGFKVP